jgi:hypothetical protein
MAALLLVLWFVIVFSFFSIGLLAHTCYFGGSDCTIAFVHELEEIEPAIFLIQFTLFFFLPVVCAICLPEGISQTMRIWEFQKINHFIKVLSPPPRFSIG